MQKHRARTYTRRRPSWLLFVLLPVLLALLVGALFLFGVLGEGAPPAPELTPAALSPSLRPSISPSASPSISPSVSPSASPFISPPASPVGAQAAAYKPSGTPETSYQLAAILYPTHNRMTAKLRVTYKNVTPDMLYELVFHLHPNAYKTAESPGAQAEFAYYPRSTGFNRGECIISAVSLDGEVAYFEESNDGMLLRVPFGRELQVGETVEVLITYALDIPTLDGRFGKSQLGYQLGNCIPILAVYQNGGWVTDGFIQIGDPFYSEAADYAVSLAYPSGYTLATTGSIVSQTEANGMVNSSIVASKVRDFACMLLTGMRTVEESVNGVRIYSHALSEESARRGASYAKGALEMCNLYLGEYPYETLTVAQAEMGSLGMEYPGLLMIQRGLYLSGRETELELTIAHEVAHQWFYGVVGSDQINAPWLDEALSSYIGLIKFEWAGKQRTYQTLSERYLQEVAANGVQVDLPLSAYPDAASYNASAYWRGAALFHALREMLGDGPFFEALSRYIENNAFHIAVKADLVEAFEAASGKDLNDFFDAWLQAPPLASPAP